MYIGIKFHEQRAKKVHKKNFHVSIIRVINYPN